MLTSANRITEQVRATGVRFVGDVLYVSLSDGREISVPLDHVEWLAWLAKATPGQASRLLTPTIPNPARES